jgi:NADPH-dependent curcumin reductase CurA
MISSSSLPIGFKEPGGGVKALNGTCSPWNYVFRRHLVKRWPIDVLMDVFGTSGLLAWFGMREYGPLLQGETVAVGAVSGSVGSMVAQLAKVAGCKVVGFASGQKRCLQLTRTLGIDGCIDYRNERFGRLRAHNHVVRGFYQLPKAIVDLYQQPRSGKLQISFEHHQEAV